MLVPKSVCPIFYQHGTNEAIHKRENICCLVANRWNWGKETEKTNSKYVIIGGPLVKRKEYENESLQTNLNKSLFELIIFDDSEIIVWNMLCIISVEKNIQLVALIFYSN